MAVSFVAANAAYQAAAKVAGAALLPKRPRKVRRAGANAAVSPMHSPLR